MPFDLPPQCSHVSDVDAWAAVLNNRDYQDKQLRVVQYASRAFAHILLSGNGKNRLGLKLFALYAQLALSRKAFKAARFFADVRSAMKHFQEAMKSPGSLDSWLLGVHWLLMGVYIFWDNMTFLAHKSVTFIHAPASRLWRYEITNQKQKNWRAMADIVGLLAALLRWKKSHERVVAVKDSPAILEGTGSAREARPDLDSLRAKRKEAGYAAVKLAADVATYVPQSTAAALLQLNQSDAFVGFAGFIASLISCRSEWMKFKKA